MPYIGPPPEPNPDGIKDLNGGKLVLDADADTSITSDTDDQIDVEISGADDFRFTANTFTVLSGSTLTIASGATIANSGTATGFSSADPSSADGDSLGTASAEWSDLYLADGGVIYFGNDQDVTITHVADTGILLNSTMAIQFNDASQYINAPSATVLDINATDEIELNATLADVNANLDVSGTYTGGGLMTTGGNIVIPDAGNIGSASDTDAIAIASDGKVTFSGTLPCFEGSGNIYQTQGHYYRGRDSSSNYEEAESKGFYTYYDASDYVRVLCQTVADGSPTWQARAAGGTVKSEIEANGDFMSATNSYGATSDERLKEHITDSGSQWADVKAMRVRKYAFKTEESREPTQLGVIAQELESAGMTGLVKTKPYMNPPSDGDGEDVPVLDENGNPTNYKTVKYSVLYMKAIKALQEAMTRIETLETKVAALESA